MRVTGPGQPAPLLLDIFDILHELEVLTAIVGALAVSYYGVPRSSVDADATIWLQGTGKSALDVQNSLAQAGYEVRLSRGEFDDPIAGVLIVKDTYGNTVDLLIEVRGMDPDAQTRRISSVLFDCPVQIIGAEDLVGMKLFAGGPQDVTDVRGILRVSRERLDVALLRKVAWRYGADVLEKLNSLLKELPLIG